MNFLQKLQEFKSCTKASSAVEFALVVPVFLAVIFSIFEVGYVFLTDLALESSLSSATRFIRTGQAQNTGMTAGQFRNLICDNSYNMINCSNVNVTVNVYSSFEAGTQLPDLLNEKGELVNDGAFDMGGRSSIIIVRTTYVHDILNPFGRAIQLANYGDNQYLQVHIAAFVNEPF